jgi:hypothetical protein
LLICAAVHESSSGTSRTSEMSDLSPQSGPQRALIRPVSPIAILCVHALVHAHLCLMHNRVP